MSNDGDFDADYDESLDANNGSYGFLNFVRVMFNHLPRMGGGASLLALFPTTIAAIIAIAWYCRRHSSPSEAKDGENEQQQYVDRQQKRTHDQIYEHAVKPVANDSSPGDRTLCEDSGTSDAVIVSSDSGLWMLDNESEEEQLLSDITPPWRSNSSSIVESASADDGAPSEEIAKPDTLNMMSSVPVCTVVTSSTPVSESSRAIGKVMENANAKSSKFATGIPRRKSRSPKRLDLMVHGYHHNLYHRHPMENSSSFDTDGTEESNTVSDDEYPGAMRRHLSPSPISLTADCPLDMYTDGDHAGIQSVTAAPREDKMVRSRIPVPSSQKTNGSK